jgi:hypothetical protein
VTVYSTFHNSCACCAVSRSTRGFGPGLWSAKGWPSRRSTIAFRPLERAADCGARASGLSSPRRLVSREAPQNPGPAKVRLTNPATTLD